MKNFTTFPAFPTGASEGLLYAARVTMGSVKKMDILGPGCLCTWKMQTQLSEDAAFVGMLLAIYITTRPPSCYPQLM